MSVRSLRIDYSLQWLFQLQQQSRNILMGNDCSGISYEVTNEIVVQW